MEFRMQGLLRRREKFYCRENKTELKPADARMKSIAASAEDVEAVGVVMGLLRSYRNHRH